ncbi:MAG TPA: protein kinase [Thermoanaerobaculia bacterium]|nr:protein kinase [Thermoanaerobaculia bacterium]
MQLASGTQLGPYEIVERVGAGGMGEVYRARDTRLSRSVAIKVLPAEFAADARLRARFEREAKTISALSDPHICTLHDVGRENGLDYLVLEYCEGVTLAHRLERGPLPLEQVLRYGIEIAEALGRAHRAGVVHRDLKPSNIMITRSGIKLLDFGLAKQVAGVPSEDSGATTSFHVTEEGTFLGTIAYMAPEVLGGGEADARSDLFALGAVLYEMLTGTAAFSGTSKASVIAAILEREPQPVRALQPGAPPALERLIRKCLVKNPDERWESAHDLAEELRWVRESTPPPGPKRQWPALVGIAAAAAGAAGIALWTRSPDPPVDRVARLSIPLPAGKAAGDPDSVVWGGISNVAFSRDGMQIAYSAAVDGRRQIYVRRLDAKEAVPVAGSEGGVGPFFSPDGQWIGFATLAHLKKVEVAGGTAQLIFGGLMGTGRGAAWADDGTIYFNRAPSSGIWKTTAAGGPPQRVTEPDRAAGENSHRWPHLLPGGKHLLFTIRTENIRSFDEAKIAVLSLESGKWKVVLEGGTQGRYVAGHLLFGRNGALYAAPFDLQSLSITGARRQVIDGVVTSPNSGSVHYSVSDEGNLVYLAGGAERGSTELLMADEAGRSRPVATLPFNVESLEMSPDGTKIAVKASAANDDIWLYDIATGGLSRFSLEGGDEGRPIWTPDGKHIIYVSLARDRILMRPADGGGGVEEVVEEAGLPESCSPDGSLLAYSKRGGNATLRDLWIVLLRGDRTPTPLMQTEFVEFALRFSPSGKWIAYQSNESGTQQIYVSRYPSDGRRWQVSLEGGHLPHWAPDERAIYYRRVDDFFVVPLSFRGGSVQPEKPRLLFSMPKIWAYDLAADGFLLARNVSELGPIRQVEVVLNWKRELQQ